MSRQWEPLAAEHVTRLAHQAVPASYANDWTADGGYFQCAPELLGRTFCIRCTDGFHLEYCFADEQTLLWKEGDLSGSAFYRAIPVPGHEEVVFVHHLRDGIVPATCVELVMDLESGYATAILGILGMGRNPRNVEHTVHFGEIEGMPHPRDAFSHGFTEELIGKAILWTMPAYTQKPPIKHIYLSPEYYAIYMTRGDQCYMAADPADYVKIKEHLFLVSIVEWDRSGIQLTFLINTEDLRDVTGHFGISAGNEPGDAQPKIVCTVITGRQGSFVPLETLGKYPHP